MLMKPVTFEITCAAYVRVSVFLTSAFWAYQALWARYNQGWVNFAVLYAVLLDGMMAIPALRDKILAAHRYAIVGLARFQHTAQVELARSYAGFLKKVWELGYPAIRAFDADGSLGGYCSIAVDDARDEGEFDLNGGGKEVRRYALLFLGDAGNPKGKYGMVNSQVYDGLSGIFHQLVRFLHTRVDFGIKSQFVEATGGLVDDLWRSIVHLDGPQSFGFVFSTECAVSDDEPH